MNKNGNKEFEAVGDIARRLLAGVSAQKYRAAGVGQAAKILQPLAETRRLGQSEEKNRRQSPQRVADNDNGRKSAGTEHVFGISLDTPAQLPCPLGGSERWQGLEMGGCTGSVLRPFAINMKVAVHPDRDYTFIADRTGREGSMLPIDAE